MNCLAAIRVLELSHWPVGLVLAEWPGWEGERIARLRRQEVL